MTGSTVTLQNSVPHLQRGIFTSSRTVTDISPLWGENIVV